MIAMLAAMLLAVFLPFLDLASVAPAQPPVPAIDLELDALIRNELAQVQPPTSDGPAGTYGVAVVNLTNGRTVSINADQLFPTASLYKLLVMYQTYHDIENGAITLDEFMTITEDDRASSEPDDDLPEGTELTVADALDAMITWSSNAAAYALVRNLGGWEALTSAADDLGLHIESRDDQVWITPADLARFYQLLAGDAMLTRSSNSSMLTLLMNQQINDRIPALLPEDTPVAHKTGEWADIRNDAGIVYAPGATYVIVLMARDVDSSDATAAEATISKIVYTHFAH